MAGPVDAGFDTHLVKRIDHDILTKLLSSRRHGPSRGDTIGHCRNYLAGGAGAHCGAGRITPKEDRP
jgi:hypothetical protein